MGPPMCDIMTGVGVWITNGEYDGGVTYYFFLKTPPTNIRRNFLIYKLFVNYFSRNFVVYNNGEVQYGRGGFCGHGRVDSSLPYIFI